MRPITRVRSQNNVFNVNDNLTDDDSLMLFDVMDGRSFFKKTPQSLTQHISSIENITRACDTGLRRQHQAYGYRLPDKEIIEAIWDTSHRMHSYVGCPVRSCRSCEASRLCQMQEILHTIQSPGLLHDPLRGP